MKVKFLMLHHSAVSHQKNSDQFKANNNYHKAKWNFKSALGYYLGYNYEISAKGRVRQARKNGEQTAACYQNQMNNGKCIHVCLDGNFDIEKPKPAQIFALRDLLKKLVKEHSINKDNIVFHRNYANKTCPGKNLDINFIRSLVSPNVIPEASKPSINQEIKQKLLDINNQLTTLIEKL